VKEKGLIFLNECGLDPGIDHIITMKLLDDIKDIKAE
jgi:saccharopine dehydrogenase-like NADP-dependent oxidoreductase